MLRALRRVTAVQFPVRKFLVDQESDRKGQHDTERKIKHFLLLWLKVIPDDTERHTDKQGQKHL